MRTLRLAQVGAQAEALRLRAQLRRTAIRAILGGVAAIFLMGALVATHIAIGMVLLHSVRPIAAVLIVGAGDLVLAIIFGLFAAISRPGRVEREALAVRETARAQVMETLTLTAVIAPLAQRLGGRKLYAIILAVLTAGYLGGRR